jgi:hypothetical protein
MFETTITESFKSWDRFLAAYYDPIRASLGLLPYVAKDSVEDLTQSFFTKLYEQDILANRPAISGKFRNWLYVAACHHAVDEYRKIRRRPERLDPLAVREPADPRPPDPSNAPFDADEAYALSVLHVTVGRVRRHLLEEGKAEHWMIFEELVLAPLFPGRVPRTRDDLLAMFPGQGPAFLDNRMTTVKRVFRRILPTLIPADPTDDRTSEERFQELVEILGKSKHHRLWLAFLLDPTPGSEGSPGSSVHLAAEPIQVRGAEQADSPDMRSDELRILLGFWLEMPFVDYLNDFEAVGPAVREALRRAQPSGAPARHNPASRPFNLRALFDGTHPLVTAIPPAEMAALMRLLKSFAKRVHHSAKQTREGKCADETVRRESSLPFEVAQILYTLAGALSLNACGDRIIGLTDLQFRKNLKWALAQPWLDARLRPVFFEALGHVRPAGKS